MKKLSVPSYKILFASCLLLIFQSFPVHAQNPNTQTAVENVFEKLEKSIIDNNIEDVKKLLSPDFAMSNMPSAISLQIFTQFIQALSLREINNIKITAIEEKSIAVNCNFIFFHNGEETSQEYEFSLLKQASELLISEMKIEMKVTVSTSESDEDVEEKNVNFDISQYSKLSTDLIETYFNETTTPNEIASNLHAKQIKGITSGENILGEKLSFPLGLILLAEDLGDFSLDIPVIPVFFNDKNQEDFNARFIMNWAYFHEMVELHLIAKGITNQNTRWYRDGLADFISSKICAELDEQTYLEIMDIRMQSYEKNKGQANLLNWIGTGDMSKEVDGTDMGDGAEYAAAMLFFTDLTKDYGTDIIEKHLKALSKIEGNITSEVLIQELNKLTNENITERLKRY